jgi:hypothetical protein
MTTQRQILDLRDGLLQQCGRPDSYLPVVAPMPATAGATGQLGW